MPTTPLDRLLFTQGGACFFCGEQLLRADASIDHLVASANGGGNGDGNCVACCKTVNALFGSMSLKEKIRVVLNQKGQFKCPCDHGASSPEPPLPQQSIRKESNAVFIAPEAIPAVIADLKRRGNSRPRRIKTLTSTIKALSKLKLKDEQVWAVVDQLRASGKIMTTGDQVAYKL